MRQKMQVTLEMSKEVVKSWELLQRLEEAMADKRNACRARKGDMKSVSMMMKEVVVEKLENLYLLSEGGYQFSEDAQEQDMVGIVGQIERRPTVKAMSLYQKSRQAMEDKAKQKVKRLSELSVEVRSLLALMKNFRGRRGGGDRTRRRIRCQQDEDDQFVLKEVEKSLEKAKKCSLEQEGRGET